MEAPGAVVGRAARIILIAAGIVAWAYALGLVGGLRTNAAAQSVSTPGDEHNPRNLVFTADHAVFTSVGDYTDCTGRAPLTHASAAIDSCVLGVRYFIGHNPGVFTGLMHAGVGSRIGYYDGSGRLHTFEVVAERTWLRSAGVPPPVRVGEAAQFQTCIAADGSVDRILDAVET